MRRGTRVGPRTRTVVGAVGIAATLALLALHPPGLLRGVLGDLERGAREAVALIGSGAARAAKPATDLAGWVGDVADATKQNKSLEREVERLHAQLAEAATDRREVIELQGLLRMRHLLAPGRRIVTARVIEHSPVEWYSTLEIDKGSSYGIHANQPVMAPGGLAGKIVATTAGTARVELITDASSGVATEVVGGSARGVVKPDAGHGDLVLDFIPKGSRVHRGALVVTSGFHDPKTGLRSVFPPGIPIGRVGAVEQTRLELGRRVQLRPAVDLRRIDFVDVVVTGNR